VTSDAESRSDARDAAGVLAQALARNPAFRVSYSNDDELRFSAPTEKGCEKIVELLDDHGVAAGRPFPTGRGWVVPVYGKETVARLKEALHATPLVTKRDGRTTRAAKRTKRKSAGDANAVTLTPGLRIGLLVVIDRDPLRRKVWWARCDCGVALKVTAKVLPRMRSCGCRGRAAKRKP